MSARTAMPAPSGDFGRAHHISYSTYLFHVPLVYALVPALVEAAGWAPYSTFIFAPVGTLCVAYVSYQVIERPFLSSNDTIHSVT